MLHFCLPGSLQARLQGRMACRTVFVDSYVFLLVGKSMLEAMVDARLILIGPMLASGEELATAAAQGLNSKMEFEDIPE